MKCFRSDTSAYLELEQSPPRPPGAPLPEYSADVQKWSEAFGEKKLHYVEVVVDKIPGELENIKNELEKYKTEKGRAFIRILKGKPILSNADFNLEKVKSNYEKLKRLNGWRKWEDHFGDYCKRKWRERTNLLDEVFVESGECAYEKPRQTVKNRKRNRIKAEQRQREG